MRVAALEVRSPAPGRLAAVGGSGLDIERLEGRFVERGQLLGEVASTDDLVVRERARSGLRVSSSAPTASRGRACACTAAPARVHPARIVRRVDAGTHQLHSAAIATTSGGDVAIDPCDPKHERTLESRYLVELEPTVPIEGAQPGMRVARPVRHRAGADRPAALPQGTPVPVGEAGLMAAGGTSLERVMAPRGVRADDRLWASLSRPFVREQPVRGRT